MTHFFTSLSLKKNWFFAGYDLRYSATGSLDVGDLPAIASIFFRDTYPRLISKDSGNEMVNFKGRSPQDLLIPDMPVPQDHELLFAHGEIASSDEGHEITWEPFRINVNTLFKEFLGLSDAVYSVVEHESREFEHTLPISLVGDALTVRLRGFRFGLEHFRPTIRRLSFGYTPAVEETFLIDATVDRLRLELVVDGSSRRVINPIETIDEYRGVFEQLSSVTRFPWSDDFTQKLSESV